MTEALKPCPFCGGLPIMQWVSLGSVQEDDPKYIKCAGCHGRASMFDHEDEAIAAWNRRPSSPDKSRIEALEREIVELRKEIANWSHGESK